MALAKLDNDWSITVQVPTEMRDGLGIGPGDEVRVERIGGKLTLVPADPVRAFDRAIERIREAIRSGETNPPGSLPPISASEEAAIERYERIMRDNESCDDE